MKKTALTLILISACFALTGEVNKQVEEIGNAVLDKLDQAKKDIIDGYNDISEKITENAKSQDSADKKNLDKDLSLGYTSYGPHRDDIKVSINNVDVRTFGSQGQQRTCALSLKLAELNILENVTKTKPVLLLDDVLSELDDNRKKRLLEYCKNTQTLITCTEFDFDVNCKKITVKNGEIV